jgi:translocation and assembly module TamB
MAEDANIEPTTVVVVERRPLWARIARWVAILLAALLLLIGALLVGLNTDPGKRFIGSQLAGYTTASGINVRVGRIEGSIYSHMVLHDLEVRDTRGVFLTSPRIAIDWHPFSYIHSLIDLDDVTAGEIRMLRNPALKPVPSDPNAPTIPDIDLTLKHLRVDRLVLEAPVTGRRNIIRIEGRAAIADRRAQLTADAAAVSAPGVAGGDRLHVKLDAVPDQNRLLIDVKLDAPAGGVVDGYARLGRPLSLSVDGSGDWASWAGRLTGTLGGQPLANLAVTAHNGTFHAVGNAMPGIALTGPAARLTEPKVAIDATTILDQRRADTHIQLASAAFLARADGLLDFATSKFGNFRIAARLLKPGSIAPNLSGRNLFVSAALDGAFARPGIAYRIGADAVAFGATGIEGLAASGNATINTDKILIPVHATARRVTGLNAAAGGLVTNLKVDGDLAYSNGQLFSDNLRLRSDRIDATALILADLGKGQYTGALKGRVNDYDVNGLGRINLVTDAKLVTAPSGGFGVVGHVRIVTKKITNASLAQQLGGNAVITAAIGYDPKVGATVRDLRMTAPDLRITSGEGGYNLNTGALRFRATAWSRTYGPASVVASGTIAKPLVVLKAAHPGVGIGLANLEAVLTGTGAGYQVRAKGGSDYGPFTADVLIRNGKGPLAVDIHQLLIAGIGIHGSVVQTAAGPFAGTLFVAGSGLDGQVALGAAGKNQKADVNLNANGARLPGKPPITIGSGLVRATLVMLPAGPSINGSAAVVDVRQGTLLIQSARARVNYAGGRGQAALIAAGSSGVPFNVAAQARFTPQQIVANLKGAVNSIAFQLAQPAVVTKQGADYVLAPATIQTQQGSVDISGRYGATSQVHARLNGIDLSIAQAFAPTLGLGGKATGTVDATMHGTAVPDARARIDIAGFTRTGALTVSDPVDIAMLGTLDAQAGGRFGALIRRGGASIGRIQARLAPIPGGSAPWSTRILQAPLSGGIRYNGPAEVLWTMTGIAGQTVAGPIAIGADFAGRVNSPQLNGVIRANQLRYENETTGTTITSIAIDGRFTQDRFLLNRMTGKAGSGTVSASGSVGFAANGGFPIDVTAQMDHAQLAKSDALGATATGSIHVTNSKTAGGLIQGTINLSEARYQIVRSNAAQVVDLTGVRRKGAPPPTVAAAAGPAPTNWKLDLHIKADNEVYVSGMGLESEWATDMRIAGTTGTPTVIGKLQVVRGTYSFAGRRLELDDTSTVQFNGPLLDPDLNIRANTTVEGVTATIVIGGTGTHPQITFTSTPTLPQDEVLSRLLFGSSVTSLSPTQALQLAAALNSLRSTGSGGLNPLGKLRGATGLDRLRVLGADSTTGRGTSLAAGKYISNNIYVEVISDAKGFTQTQLTVALSKALSILSQAGGATGPAVQLRYSKQY